MKNKKWMTIQVVKVRIKFIIALFAIITVSSCGDDDGDSTNPQDDINVRIIEVDASADEVTLQNFGADEANIGDYWFCLRRNYEQLSDVIIASGDLTLNQNETVTFSVTVNDEGSDVSIYNSDSFTSASALVDFMQFNGSYTDNGREDVAVAKGIWAAGAFVEGSSVFTYNGDGTENGADQWSGDAVAPQESNVRIIEVDPLGDLVTLKNLGDEAEDISSYFFCFRKTYPGIGTLTPVSGDLTLDPNEEVQFSIEINDVSSDVSIYLNNAGFAAAENMIDFMQFGEDVGDAGRVSVAVTKGIWTAGEFVDGTSPFSFTGSLDDTGASFWESIVAEAAIRIISINPDTESVTIKNLGTAEQDISAYEFCLGPGNYNPVNNYATVTGDFVLSADEEVTIDLTSSNDKVADLPASGGLGLFKDGNGFGSEDPEQLKDYVQWGAANQPRVGQAVNANRWDNADNFVSGTAPFNFSGGANDAGSTFWQ